jgi:putative membrane protein
MTEPDPRIYFAAERTMLAWIRTGLAMMGFGFVVARFGVFAREVALLRGTVTHENGGSLWAGVGLILLGIVVNLFAAASHRSFKLRYRRGDVEPRESRFGTAIAVVLAAIGLAMVLFLVGTS